MFAVEWLANSEVANNCYIVLNIVYHLKYYIILLPPIKAAEIVECVCK